MSQIKQLCESISQIIKDYREDELGNDFMNQNHVYNWIKQFNPEYQEIILKEMNAILKRNYISKIQMHTFLDNILKSQFNTINKNTENVCFLKIQKDGASQNELLDILKSINLNKYNQNIKINHFNDPDINTYIYIDDGIFSGNTLYYDLKRYIDKFNFNSKILIYTYAIHKSGLNYNILNRSKKLLKTKNIEIDGFFIMTYDNVKPNYYNYNHSYGCLLPRTIKDNKIIDDYINKLEAEKKSSQKSFKTSFFRDFDIPEDNQFSSSINRDIIESTFLEHGINILNCYSNPKTSMRPMGYDPLISLGFGNLFVSYRNIPNNSPLVLWWGNTNQSQNANFNNWYPLFPRITNEKIEDYTYSLESLF